MQDALEVFQSKLRAGQERDKRLGFRIKWLGMRDYGSLNAVRFGSLWALFSQDFRAAEFILRIQATRTQLSKK